uniref:Uncharacterized protein n=1 Tax=Myotis myotis TaxID=51298 RepID=A0A7J7ZY15_MYOMY|nr:hypothetical protein mMyoMyo1_010017 [Myotis myotis]
MKNHRVPVLVTCSPCEHIHQIKPAAGEPGNKHPPPPPEAPASLPISDLLQPRPTLDHTAATPPVPTPPAARRGNSREMIRRYRKSTRYILIGSNTEGMRLKIPSNYEEREGTRRAFLQNQ